MDRKGIVPRHESDTRMIAVQTAKHMTEILDFFGSVTRAQLLRKARNIESLTLFDVFVARNLKGPMFHGNVARVTSVIVS